MATPAHDEPHATVHEDLEDLPEDLQDHDAREAQDDPRAGGAEAAESGSPITDEEYSKLGKTLGMLLHRIMRARQENDGGGNAVLAMLAKCGPVRASDIAKELFLDLSTVSRHVQHLERDGLIERAPDPNDRRATTLHLTGLGEKQIADFWQRRIDAMREGLGSWDPEEMRTLMRLLDRYVDDYIGIIGRGAGHDNNS